MQECLQVAQCNKNTFRLFYIIIILYYYILYLIYLYVYFFYDFNDMCGMKERKKTFSFYI